MNPLILISGEGRSGTTMLWELFCKLGFDGGGHIEWLREVRPPYSSFPEVIKHSGGFAVNLAQFVSKYNWNPSILFYTVNDMKTNISKRIYTDKQLADESGWGVVGTKIGYKTLGITSEEFNSLKEHEKESLLKQTYEGRLGKAAYGSIEAGVPFSLIHYQRFCYDVEYAMDIITPVLRLKKFTLDDFRRIHKEHIDLKKVRPWVK